MVDNIKDWYMQGFEMSNFGVPAVGHNLAGSKDYRGTLCLFVLAPVANCERGAQGIF